MQWSTQQAEFLNWVKTGKGSCILTAVAGAGKTTTLIEAARVVKGSVALMAFNKKIADEIVAKLAERDVPRSKAHAGTVHSFGFAAFRKSIKHVKVDGDKVANILDRMYGKGTPLFPFHYLISKLVSLAKQRAVGAIYGSSIPNVQIWNKIAEHYDVFGDADDMPSETRAKVIDAAIVTLTTSNSDLTRIDFDDMVYLPLLLCMPFDRFDVVMVDEAQDTNPARRLLVARMLRRGGRVIAVGDPHQAIYGFTGADNDSLDKIAHEFKCIHLPLTTTFRCPKAVVEFSRQWVSHIEAADSAPQGEVKDAELSELLVPGKLDRNSAILCRNTKPLVSMALRLLRNRIPCRIEGRDIGATIVKLSKRWKLKSLSDLPARLETYLTQEKTKLQQAKKFSRIQILEDTVGTLLEIVEQCQEEGRNDMKAVEEYVERLFGDDVKNVVTLSTIHKSKGREWEQVYWLDRDTTCPSPWARLDWQQEQERNLCYVAATRAKSTLIEVTTPQ